jgi:hypothetical protein
MKFRKVENHPPKFTIGMLVGGIFITKQKYIIMELKHLLPYIEGGKLICEMLDYKSDYVGKQFDRIVGVHQWDRLDKYWSVLTVGGSKPSLDRIKPILEPLSNLTKPITRNGVTFVAIEWFREKDFSHCDWVSKEREHWVKEYGYDKWLNDIPFGIVQQLIEWKFDIFGLIEKGKAIAATNEYN